MAESNGVENYPSSVQLHLRAEATEQYLSLVRLRLPAEGFEPCFPRLTQDGGFRLIAHRKQFESACLKSVDTFCLVTELPPWPRVLLALEEPDEYRTVPPLDGYLKGGPNPPYDQQWISSFVNDCVLLVLAHKKLVWCLVLVIADGLSAETVTAIRSGTVATGEMRVEDAQRGDVVADGHVSLMLLAHDLKSNELIYGKKPLWDKALYPAFTTLAQKLFAP